MNDPNEAAQRSASLVIGRKIWTFQWHNLCRRPNPFTGNPHYWTTNESDVIRIIHFCDIASTVHSTQNKSLIYKNESPLKATKCRIFFLFYFCFVVLCWSGTFNIAGGNQWALFSVSFCFVSQTYSNARISFSSIVIYHLWPNWWISASKMGLIRIWVGRHFHSLALSSMVQTEGKTISMFLSSFLTMARPDFTFSIRICHFWWNRTHISKT